MLKSDLCIQDRLSNCPAHMRSPPWRWRFRVRANRVSDYSSNSLSSNYISVSPCNCFDDTFQDKSAAAITYQRYLMRHE